MNKNIHKQKQIYVQTINTKGMLGAGRNRSTHVCAHTLTLKHASKETEDFNSEIMLSLSSHVFSTSPFNRKPNSKCSGLFWRSKSIQICEFFVIHPPRPLLFISYMYIHLCVYIYIHKYVKVYIHMYVKELPAKAIAEIDLCREWASRPSASAKQRPPGRSPHQCGWLDYACATTQRELAWIWIIFLSEQRRMDDFVETAAGCAANNSLYNACTSWRSFAIVSMAKTFVHRYIGAHACLHVHFWRLVWHAWEQVFWAPVHVQVYTLYRCFDMHNIIRIVID